MTRSLQILMEKWCFRNTSVMVSEIKDNNLENIKGNIKGLLGLPFFSFLREHLLSSAVLSCSVIIVSWNIQL